MNIIILFLFSVCLMIPAFSKAENSDKTERLMTLFTTKAERNKLDQMRKLGKFEKYPDINSSRTEVLREPSKVELKGIMLKENSKPIVWLNKGNTLKSNNISSQISVKTHAINKDQLIIPIKVSQKQLKMKPGQQWSESDNKVKDTYSSK